MTRMEETEALRARTDVHYNCCQSVLVPFADLCGLDKETAFKLGANFGSGMRHGSTCGAVTGALMVFERKNMLDDAIKTGTALDCTVNAELLKNIFWNKAPLHDGAVIVRAGRIVGAGCMLPMSGNVNLSRELGMRHRAGIGASEHTDAVVAIVSEETGSISVAVGGMLKRHLAPETLERLLRNELLPERENDEAASKFKLGNLLRFGKGKKQDGNENS